MADESAGDLLVRARSHLQRVQTAWSEPDWDQLAVWGFYCLEAAVMAAGARLGLAVRHNHASKVEAAAELHTSYGLPDVSQLIRDLNTARKYVAYGDVSTPDLDAEDVADAIETFVEAVALVVLST